MIPILLAIFTGTLITVVPIMNGQNTLVLGTLRTSFYHYTFAFFFGLLTYFMLSPIFELETLVSFPYYYYLGGIVGLSLLLLMNYYSVRIKALYIVVLPFIGQMVMGILLDLFYFDATISPQKLLGLLVVLVGLLIQHK